MNPVLLGEDLSWSIGRRPIVREVSLAVGRGQIVGLLGPNGAGKTTCFNLLSGVLRPDSGRIHLGGVEVTAQPLYARARKGLGLLPQQSTVFEGLTVFENVLLVLEARARGGPKAQALAETHLRLQSLWHLRDQQASGLSGGERRRLDLARILALEPSVLLLDEPFAGLDPLGIQSVRQWVRGLAGGPVGVLLTDHSVRDCFEVCDRLYLLADGRIQAEGTPPEIERDPVARRAYLGTLDP